MAAVEGFDQVSVEPVVSDPKLPYSIKEGRFDRVYLRNTSSLANALICWTASAGERASTSSTL